MGVEPGAQRFGQPSGAVVGQWRERAVGQPCGELAIGGDQQVGQAVVREHRLLRGKAPCPEGEAMRQRRLRRFDGRPDAGGHAGKDIAKP